MKRLLALVLFVNANVNEATANPVDAFGFGARGPAMGNAQTAASDDNGAHYFNPAILATFEDIRIDIGYQYADPKLLVNGLDLNVNRSRGIAVGISVPGVFGPVRIGFGGAVYLPDEQATRTRTLQGDQPRWVLFDNRPQRLFMAANVAVSIGDKVFIGGGLGYLSSTTGGVTLGGRLHPVRPEESDLLLEIDIDLETVRYPQAGVLWRALPWLDVGGAYRGGFVLNVDLAFRIDADIGPEGGPYIVEDGFFAFLSEFQDLFQPEQWAVGAAARIHPNLNLAFDLVWHRWSAYDNPSTIVEIEFDLKDLNDLVMIPEAPPLPAPGFHDILVPHVGVEWIMARTNTSKWQLRAGYTFEPTPTPVQTGETNFIDGDKHTVGLGLGMQFYDVTEVLPRPFDIDLYVAYTMFEEQVHRKLSPTDRIGDYRADGRIWQMGASTRWRF